MFVRSLGVLIVSLAFVVAAAGFAESPGAGKDEASEMTREDRDVMYKKQWAEKKAQLEREKEMAEGKRDATESEVDGDDDADDDDDGADKSWKEKKAYESKSMKSKGQGYGSDRGKSEMEKAEQAGGKAAGEAQDKAGQARGDEMKTRRDERKEIMQEAKAAQEPGTPRKGKKPWWRFWESDESGE